MAFPMRNTLGFVETGSLEVSKNSSSELELVEPLKLPISMKPGVSLIGNAMKTGSS
jgi:hypothetical protein